MREYPPLLGSFSDNGEETKCKIAFPRRRSVTRDVIGAGKSSQPRHEQPDYVGEDANRSQGGGLVEFFCIADKCHLQLMKDAYVNRCFESDWAEPSKRVLYIRTNLKFLNRKASGPVADRRTEEDEEDKEIEIFIFDNGPVVAWNSDGNDPMNHYGTYGSAADPESFRPGPHLKTLLYNGLYRFTSKAFRKELLEKDWLWYCYISDLPEGYEIPPKRMKNNKIYLKTYTLAEKLAISFALSQSIRLEVYESSVARTVEQFKELPQKMARHGRNLVFQPLPILKVAVGDIEVIKKIVEVNLLEDFLDVPEYFWENDEWQHLWKRVCKVLS